MSGFLALDQSKSRTGWAFWDEGHARPIFGNFKLGDEYSSAGSVFARLHMELNALHQATGFDSIRYEQPADPSQFDRQTPFNVPFLLIGIAAHINSYCAAKAVRRCDWVPAATWRRHFIGSMKRGTKKTDLKEFVRQRCLELGMKPRNDDESDALGILDFDIHIAGITPPWRIETPLVRQLGGAR